MVPPDSSFHFHTRSTNSSRPRSRRFGSWRSINWRSTTIWVAMPAWSVPGCHSTSRPRMRSKRTSTSCSVLLRACPIWSEPVTFGGGMTMAKGRASARSARPRGKRVRLFPEPIDRALDGGWLIGLVEHRRLDWRRDRGAECAPRPTLSPSALSIKEAYAAGDGIPRPGATMNGFEAPALKGDDSGNIVLHGSRHDRDGGSHEEETEDRRSYNSVWAWDATSANIGQRRTS